MQISKHMIVKNKKKWCVKQKKLMAWLHMSRDWHQLTRGVGGHMNKALVLFLKQEKIKVKQSHSLTSTENS